jgi:O-antigen/teichoic acid export membrane protein
MVKAIGNINLKSDFIKNIITLLSGATIAQAITFISIPILSRIYTPEDFGFIAIYLSIANIIATVSTGRYELAVMLPKNNIHALAIIKGTLRLILIASSISLIIVVVLKQFDNKVSNLIQPFYFYFLPVGIGLLGLTNVFSQWFTRQKEFKLQAKTKILKSGTNSSVNVALGFLFNLRSLGLFIGHIAGQFVQTLIFSFKFFKEEKSNLKTISGEAIKTEFKKNLNFPYYSAPMGFLNTISVDILIYVLNLFYTTSLVGLYTNANKVINYPLSLISQSFTSVFYQKISETNRKTKLYLISYFANLIIVTIAMIPIVFWGEEIFIFILGKDWEIAGSIAKYLVPLTIASFAMRSVSNIFSLTRKNGILLIWQIIYLILILVTIFIFKSDEFEKMLLSVSFIGAILYFLLAFIGYKIMIKQYDKIN